MYKLCEIPKLMRLVVLFMVLFIMAFIVTPSLAQTSQEMNFQGKIVLLSNGTNVNNVSTPCIKTSGADTCDFEVAIYNVANAGVPLWTERHVDVELYDNNGVFNLEIGSYCITNQSGSWTSDGDGLGTRCTVNSGGVDWANEPNLYIEIRLDDTDTTGENTFVSPEVFSRKKITSVPFAFTSQAAISSTILDNPNGVITFNDTNTTSAIPFSDISNTTLTGGYTSILEALNASLGGGGGLWTINGNITYLTSSGSDLSLSSTLVSPFSVKTNENRIRFGDTSTNAIVEFYSSTGDTGKFEYKQDTLEWGGGQFRLINDTNLAFGNTDQFRLNFNSTSTNLEMTDGTNRLFSFIDNGSTGSLNITGALQLQNSTFNIGLQAPSLTASYNLTLPTTAGANGNFLQTDGSGNLSWVNPSLTMVAESGPVQTISPGDSFSILGGTAINTITSNTDTLTINFDPTANLDISGQWEFQNNIGLRFGNSANMQVVFDGTDTLNINDGTNTLMSIIDTGTTGRIRLGSGTNDIFSVGSTGIAPDGSLYWGNRLLCDATEANCGWATAQGSSRWTYDNILDITYLTDTVSDLAVGGIDSTSPLFFDASAGRLDLSTNGSLGGIRIGTDGDLFRGGTNLLQTNNNFTLAGTLTANTGANIYGGDVLVQGTVPYNIVLDNSTTGTNANSGMLVLRGNASTSTQIDFNLRTTISGASDYRLSFLNNLAGTEVAYIDESGNLRANGNVTIGATADNILGTAAAVGSATSDLYWGDRLLCDASELNCGWANSQGSSKFTDTGTLTYLTDTTDDLVLGGTTTLSPFFFDTSVGQLILNSNGSTAGVVIGSDTQLYRSAANVLRTPDALTVDGVLTGSTGASISGGSFTVSTNNPTFSGTGIFAVSNSSAQFTGGDLIVRGTTGPDIVIDNSTTGANASSGLLVLRGNAWDGVTNFERDFNIQTSIVDANTYRISFMNTAAGNEVGSLDQSGNIQVDGRVNIGTNTSDILGVGIGTAAANGNLYWGDKLLCTASASNCGWASSGGSSKWDDSTILRPNDTNIDFAVGGSTLASAFSVDVSANLARIGSGSGTNSVLQMFGSDGDTGTITYTTEDRWVFAGGDLLVSDDNKLMFGNAGQFYLENDSLTNRLEIGYGANVYGFIDDVALQNYGTFNFYGTTILGTGLAGSETALLINTQAAFTGDLLDLQVDGGSVFRVSTVGLVSNVPATFASAGDVQIDNDLTFTNSTSSNILSDGPLYITAGAVVGDNDLILRANNNGYVIIDDRLEVTDKILLGTNVNNFLSTSAQASVATDNLYWGDQILCDISNGSCGSVFTDAGTIAYVSDISQDFAVGGTNLSSVFSIDTSDQLFRFGTGTTTNARIDLLSSNGNSARFEMTTADVLELYNAGFTFNSNNGAVNFIVNGNSVNNLIYASGANNSVGIGTTNSFSFFNIIPSTTAKAQINLASGVDPTAPNDGDLWYNGTNLYFRRSSSTIDLLNPIQKDYIYIRDEKASGTSGGTFTSGAWQTRDINTEVSDVGNNVIISTNQFTLEPGTYTFKASAPAYNVGQHRLRLQNITDVATIAIGTSTFANDMAVVRGRFTIGTAKTFEIQHRATTTQSADGYGVAASFGDAEVYAEIELWKE